MGMGGIPRYQLLEGQREVAFYRAGYDGEVAYVDAEIGRLLARVAELGLAERSAIVFASDHGEGFGEDDYWFAHGEYLSDPLVRVPLLLSTPGRPPAVRDDVVSLTDVLPTLARLLGGDPPPGLPGRDLLAPDAAAAPGFAYLATLGEASVPRIGLVRGEARYVRTLAPGGPTETVAAVRSTSVLASDRATLAHELDAFRATRFHGTDPSRRQPLSPEDRDRLRALGYVDTDG